MEAFLSILCEDTEIAELELQMGSFQLKVGDALLHMPTATQHARPDHRLALRM